ncbi:hypothetical protein [Klebsiella pneumoniae]|nr:hypothetical protein [Klebsiella pneumoniae]
MISYQELVRTFPNACYFFAEVIYQQAGVKFVEADILTE